MFLSTAVSTSIRPATASATGAAAASLAEEVAYCFKHVPAVFFRAPVDFSLKHTDIFTEPAEPLRRLVEDQDQDQDREKEKERESQGTGDDRGLLERVTASSGDRRGALYTVDLGDDDEDDVEEDRTDHESSSSSARLGGINTGSGSGSSSGSDGHGGVLRHTGRRNGQGLFNMETARILTGYLDLVEVALLRQIVSRSPSFFRALDDINCLHNYVSRAAVRVIHIRRQLRQTSDGEIAGDIRIPKLERRRRNEVVLNVKIQSMQR